MIMQRVLIIKLGALGDFIQALGPIEAIRNAHPDAAISLLTTAPFREFAEACPFIDHVLIDEKPRLWQITPLIQLRRSLRAGRFQRIYDLQTSDRSSFYYQLMGPDQRPEWSGIARGASHPHRNPHRNHLHTIDRQRDQLATAGIHAVPLPDLSWAEADLAPLALTRPFLALIPGGSAHRPEKRWPIAGFIGLADLAAQRGIQPIILGGRGETPLAAAIIAAVETARDLTGRTDLLTLATIGRAAFYTVGNDTGPMHVLAAAGSPATVLYSAASDPALTAPRGANVTILRRNSLADLTIAEVAATLPIG